jgi:UDP-N-acetylmuramate dehydrogenase
MTTSRTAASRAISFNEPLKPFTTFKIGGPARYFSPVLDADQVRAAIDFARHENVSVLVLGGGSNVLISDRGFDGLILHPASEGMTELDSEIGYARLRIDAGEPWDRAVAHTVSHSWWGIENLSHIPGQSGAALVQNIGAYGQQLSDTLESAEVLELSSGRVQRLSSRECGHGYRQSIFNRARKGEFFILAIELKLWQEPNPNLSYKDVKAYFEQTGIHQPPQAEIRAAIIAIRDRKFPYPREERGGNAGSFFKNPTLSAAEYRGLEGRIGTRFGSGVLTRLQDFGKRSRDEGSVKVAAAFLIDICGLRGAEVGRAQVNPTQPLVILNLGGATADDVMRLARRLRGTVYRETGVPLELEPELVGFSPEEIRDYLSLG